MSRLENRVLFLQDAVNALYIVHGLERPVPAELPVPHVSWLRRLIHARIVGTIDDATYRPQRWLADRLATRKQRERAWAAGFALAFGGAPGGMWLQRIPDFHEGNAAAWEAKAPHWYRTGQERRLAAVPEHVAGAQ